MRSVHAGFAFSLTHHKPGIPDHMSAVTTVYGENLAETLNLVRKNPGIHVLSLGRIEDAYGDYVASLPQQLTEIIVGLGNAEGVRAYSQSHVTRFSLRMGKNKTPESQRQYVLSPYKWSRKDFVVR